MLTRFLGLGLLGLSLAGSAQAGSKKELEARVAELEEDLAQVRAEIKLLKERPLPATRDTGKPSADDERRAADLMRTAHDLSQKAGGHEEALAILGKIRADYAATRASFQAKRLMKELAVIGARLEQPSISKWFSKSEAQIDDGLVLVAFFEVWCPHCQREMPQLQKTADTFASQGLQVVGLTRVTRSSTDEQVAAFVRNQEIRYPVGKEDGKTAEAAAVSGIPAVVLVQDGVIVWRGHPAQLTDEMIQDRL